MNNASPRPIFVSALIGALAIYCFSSVWDNRTLSRRNVSLQQQSEAIQKMLVFIQNENSGLSSNFRNNTKETSQLRESVETLKKQNETLAFQLKKIESQIGTVKEEKSHLEEMLINKTKEIEILKERPASSAPSVSVDTGEVRAAIGEKDDQLKKLNEENKILQEKLDRLFKTTHEKINEINVAKIALAETVSTAQRRIEDEWNTVNLGAVTTRAMPARQNEIEEAPVPHTAKTEGHVLAINNEHGFVVVDLGKVDNLSSDAQLEIKKDGVPVATLSVLEIRDVMAACNIQYVQDGQRIEINDPVSILR